MSEALALQQVLPDRVLLVVGHVARGKQVYGKDRRASHLSFRTPYLE